MDAKFMDIVELIRKTQALTDQAAENGAAWLDEVRPGWDADIDISILDIDDEEFCICGQLWMDTFKYGTGYLHAFYEVFPGEEGDEREKFAEVHGFDAVLIDDDYNGELISYYMEELTLSWAHLIEKRRANA